MTTDADITTWSGRTQESKNKDFINVADYGAIGDGVLHPLSEKYSNLAAAQIDYPQATSLTDSIDWAAFQKAFKNDVNVYANHGLFILNKPLVVGKQLRRFIGTGHGAWDTIFHNRKKTWDGTNLIFTDLAKLNTIKGITSQNKFGGSRPDNDDPTKIYNLTSFMQKDGTNTAKPFSAAISFEWAENSGTNAQILESFRLVPANGENFISEYDKPTDSLGADIDIGIYRLNTEYNQIRNFQVVGYWRIAAVADVQTGQGVAGRGERNTLENGTLQGFCGLLERASDLQPITAYTSNSFTIPYFDEWYFNPTGSCQLGVLSGYYNWTGINVNQSVGTITFTGVTPEITTNIIGFQFRSFFRGTGKAGTRYINLMVHGLNHKSGKTGKQLGFSEFTRAHEVSGWPIRGVEYFTFKSQMVSNEPLSAFYGNMADAQFYGSQHESGKVLATPYTSQQTWAEYPCFDTRAIRMYSWIANDKSMFTPRSSYDDQELFSMSDLSGYFKINLPATMSTQIIKNNSQSIYYYNSTAVLGGWNTLGNFEIKQNVVFTDNSSKLIFTGNAYLQANSTNSLTIYGGSGTVAPGRGTNIQSLGSSAESWLSVYSKKYMHTSQVGILFGEGDPNGQISASVGSMYLRTDGGEGTTLYVKETGVGSMGWVAK
ncbi:hypothetical protein QTA56_03365 [Acinetobacter sp. VNH17]|uniref:Uncharacterized protein n=1 Tax=Acinetobacter thutiue TaxID=2998078 RepID=A0ABT7WL32_9GAMM|nr:hypothetical protein [Acinetobacter thutiue]MCY6411177.1 hypothetical protein [Acinetobacter thutiue]MDN0013279.1 hypothetical protein [Acinetobacter thutiue]